MSSMTIELPEERLQKLRELAAELGVTPDELLRASVEDLLNRSGDEFNGAVEYVLEKYEELLRRLA